MTMHAEKGIIDIWHLDLTQLTELERLKPLVTLCELTRAERLVDPQAGHRCIAGRAFLRQTLADYLTVEPARIELVEEKWGKPYLRNVSPPLQFNVSHSGNHLLLAVTMENEVGIDLEQIREDVSFVGIAERYFSQAERAELFSLAPELQREAFYRCWTRKEAYMKGSGTGFSRRPDSFDVTLSDACAPQILADREAPEESARWGILDVDAPAGYRASVACRGECPSLRYIGKH